MNRAAGKAKVSSFTQSSVDWVRQISSFAMPKAMNITVMRYQDSLDFGVIACRESVPDVSDIALGFGAAVADLLKGAFEDGCRSDAGGAAA